EVLAGHVVQVQAADVERIERAVVDVPQIAAERSARDLILRPVVVAPPASERLHSAVAAYVIGRSEPRRELVGKAELERILGDVGPEGRDVLLLRAGAEITRQTRADGPRVLDIEVLDV